MAQTRLSLSVDQEHAAAIREAARRRGLTVSAYIEGAAMEAVARDARIRALFAVEWEAYEAAEALDTDRRFTA
ncbi:ribbon-helix-helix protein, CopG family [Streptomyces sp. P1-3]|uniref:ribbon-helix-helix protein, CopG family n=1 Tax=Streptomyces sp. P1-3 TaxID=3421658 RepID=UPI003D35D892